MATKKKPSKRRAQPGNRRLTEALDQAQFLITRRRWEEAHELLVNLDRTYPQRPEVLRYLVEVAVPLRDAHIYQYACERLHALCPRDKNLLFMLTVAYIQNNWPAMALVMGRRALAEDPANEKAESTRRLVADLLPFVTSEIERLGLDGPDGLECLTMHDQVRSFLAHGRYAKADEVADQLIKRRPRIAAAYNNGAEACFHDGRIARAIELEQRLLAFDPDNLFALANLVRFQCISGKLEEARRNAERLKAVSPLAKDHAVKQAEALSWLGDDGGVLAVFERGRQLENVEGPTEEAFLHHLAAVAHYRQGREEEAIGHWRSALRAVPHFELARTNLDDLNRPMAERNAPWFYSMAYYVPRKVIDGLVKRLGSASAKNAKEAERREAQQYLQAHPELEGLVPLLLDRSDVAGRELALHLAGLFRTPAMLHALGEFARGQRGTDRQRFQAAALADDAGPPASGAGSFWLNGEWRAGTFQRFEIHTDVVERTHAPGVFDLLTTAFHALRAGNPARAEPVLRKALAIDPDDPLVMNNLAVACAQLGRPQESEALSLRLLERHPDYLFGRTALASLAAERGDLDRAKKLLEPLLSRKRLHLSEFTALCQAQVNLFLAEGNRAQAQNWLGMWRKVMPDHPALRHFESLVRSLPK